MRALNFVVLALSSFVFLKQLTEDIMLTTQFVMHSFLLWQNLRKAFHIFFCTACHHAVLRGLESLFAVSININVKLFALYLCSGLLDCEICQSHINKYMLCASWRYFHIHRIWSTVCWTQLKYSNWLEQFVLSECARWIQLFINHSVFSKCPAENMHMLKKTTNSYSRGGRTEAILKPECF